MKTRRDVVITLGFTVIRYENVDQNSFRFQGVDNGYLSFKTYNGLLIETTMPYVIETHEVPTE